MGLLLDRESRAPRRRLRVLARRRLLISRTGARVATLQRRRGSPVLADSSAPGSCTCWIRYVVETASPDRRGLCATPSAPSANSSRGRRRMRRTACTDSSERVRHSPAADASDEVIEQRIRARLGHAVLHPGAVDLAVVDRRVILRGSALHRGSRRDRALRAVDVRCSRSRRPARASREPARRTGAARRPGGNVQGAWNPTLQAGATVAGALMLLYGLLVQARHRRHGDRRGGRVHSPARRVNRPVGELFGKRAAGDDREDDRREPADPRGVRPVVAPRQLPAVHGPRAGSRRSARRPQSRWTVDGPAGYELVEFEAETTRCRPDRVIAWQTIEEQPIEH